jgi:2-dehydro-3-deoxygluconokinase
VNKKILSFGELLLRICPDAGGEWLQQNQLPFYVGGAEANVATALALWGVPSAYCSVLPDHSVARQVDGYLRSKGVDTSPIRWQGDRLGMYFLTKGKDLKNAGVIYDRNGSSFSELRPGTLDWDEIFRDISWLHFSAISPALNTRVAAVCEEAVKAAVAKKIPVSLDLNYRAKLWQYGKQPVEVIPGLASHCDLIMGNIWAVEKMLGIPTGKDIHADSGKEEYIEQARLTSEKIQEQFPRVKIVANTFRFDEGLAGIRYYTTLFVEGFLHVSGEYCAEMIVDKVGSGDCFMAGLLYGLYKRLSPAATLEFATAAAFQKLFVLSDATDRTVADIEAGSLAYAGKL